jgi:hypothetical protein
MILPLAPLLYTTASVWTQPGELVRPSDLAQPIEEHSLGEAVSGFALVEARRDAAAQDPLLRPGFRSRPAGAWSLFSDLAR